MLPEPIRTFLKVLRTNPNVLRTIPNVVGTIPIVLGTIPNVLGTIPNDPERFRMIPNVHRKTLPMADRRRTSPIVAERSNLDVPNV